MNRRRMNYPKLLTMSVTIQISWHNMVDALTSYYSTRSRMPAQRRTAIVVAKRFIINHGTGWWDWSGPYRRMNEKAKERARKLFPELEPKEKMS